MKKNLNKITLFVILLIPISFLLALDQPGTKTPFSKTFRQSVDDAYGKTLYLTDSQADISIKGTKNKTITVEATIDISEMEMEERDAFFAHTKLELLPTANGFKITLNYPQSKTKSSFNFLGLKFFIKKYSIAIQYNISVPDSMALQIENEYGDISVQADAGVKSKASGKNG